MLRDARARRLGLEEFRTNPVATIIFKTLIALKGRNALLVSCHRDAAQVSQQTIELIRTVLRRHATPEDVVQLVPRTGGRHATEQLMRHPDVALILATGGPGLVHAAYSSGTPAIGVESGNTPVWICTDADPDRTAELIVASKAFDHGIVCASESNLVVDVRIQDPFEAALRRHGAAVLTASETRNLVASAFDENGRLRRDVLGQSAPVIARRVCIQRDAPIRLLVVPAQCDDSHGPLGREKLAPMTSLFVAQDVEDGLSLCKRLLAADGLGHTAVIHTSDRALTQRFGLEVPASRILVSVPATQGAIGIGTGLAPSLTLGCGSFGRTSTTDKITYTHLLNIKRMAGATSSSVW
jgi:acetaldehyde dehydrogenase / alcohol dehydrogenase